MKSDMGSQTLPRLVTRTQGSHEDPDNLIRWLITAAEPLDGRFDGSAKAAVDRLKARGDEVHRGPGPGRRVDPRRAAGHQHLVRRGGPDDGGRLARYGRGGQLRGRFPRPGLIRRGHMATQDRLSYDTGASAEAQGNLQAVAARLESVMNDRDQAVKTALADFSADGVSDLYHDKEVRWNNAAHEVRTIIALVKKTLHENDSTANHAQSRARAAVDAI
jgi:hypothetical protein